MLILDGFGYLLMVQEGCGWAAVMVGGLVAKKAMRRDCGMKPHSEFGPRGCAVERYVADLSVSLVVSGGADGWLRRDALLPCMAQNVTSKT